MKNNLSYRKFDDTSILKNSNLELLVEDNYFLIKNIPKNLSEVSVNDSVFKIEGVKNFFMGEALRFKEYKRYGFVLINKNRKPEDMLKELSEISFNYAEIEFELKTLEKKYLQVLEYTDKFQVFEDFYLGNKVLERFLAYNSIEEEPVKEFFKGKDF